MRFPIVASLALFIGLSTAAHAAAPTFGGCPVFPADNYWNSPVDGLAVHPSSAAWVNAISSGAHLHPDFGSGYGFSPRVVPGSQPGVPITISDPAHSDPGPMPIPPALATGSGDREVSVTENSSCTLYEFYGSPVNSGASWTTNVAAKWSLGSNALRPDGWESGDHAGFPYLVGLARWQEVAAGEVAHAIRMTSSSFSSLYLWPARHSSGTSADPGLPPMGARFRLKASFDISGFDSRTQVLLRAFKKYGVVLASPGGSWFIQGDDDVAWPDTVVNELALVHGSDFEAVDTAPLLIDANSGQAHQVTSPGGGGSVTNPNIAQVLDAGPVFASAVQADGKVVIGGQFSYVGGVARSNIARLNADGSLDTTWNPGASSFVSALAIDGAGNIYAGGNFGFIAGAGRNYIAKLSPVNGAADPAWNPGADNVIGALALDGAGNLYVGGDFNNIGGVSRTRLARLSTTSGAVDGWNPGADGFVWTIAPDGSGNVFVGGNFVNIGGAQRNYLAKVSAASGATDPTWNAGIDPNGNNGVHAMLIAGGTLYASGEWFTIGGQPRAYLARFPTSGSGAFDTTWNAQAGSTMYALAFDGTNLYVGGAFNSIGGQQRNGVARIPLPGASADGWNPFSDAPVRTIALGGGTAYVGGNFTSIGGQQRGGFGAISAASGSMLASSASVLDGGEVFAIARDASGRTTIGGRFITLGDFATMRSNIARFNADGSLDATWNPNANGHVRALAQDASGSLYAGGDFSFIGGQSRGFLARLSTGGTGAADAWNPGADYSVIALAADPAGNVFAGGAFSNMGGLGRAGIAKISSGGVVDSSWNPTADRPVTALVADSSGNVFAGGQFNTIGGLARSRIAKLPASGSGGADPSWNPGANADVDALVLDTGGNLFAGGEFTSIGGQSRGRLA